MSEFSDFLPWVLFERTCRTLLDVKYESAELSAAFRILSQNPKIRAYLEHIVQLYQWHHAGDLAEITRRVASGCTSDMNFCDDTGRIKTRLRLLVSDIQEMRPFLLHNFKPENVVVKVTNGVVVSWWWAVGRGVGLVPIAPSGQVMLSELRKMSNCITLTLLYDGLLACYAMPWLDAAALQAVHDYALETNLRIVEAIHDALWRLYEKVDLEAVLARFRVCAKSREPTDEEFAASCQVIAEPIEDDSGVLPAPTAPLKAIRMQRLLAVLADRLGCEVRQGRGSEIVVYRSGGHHF